MMPHNTRPSLENESGATLIELLLSIVISGILLGALTLGIMTYMRSATATRALMAETGELQVAATHFATDVQAAETVAIGGAAPVCGALPAGETTLVGFRWRDYTSRTAFTTIDVSYTYVSSANEFRRRACQNGNPQAETTLLRRVQPSHTPEVFCDGLIVSSTPCSPTPQQVDVGLQVCTVDEVGTCLNTPIPAKVTGVRRLS